MHDRPKKHIVEKLLIRSVRFSSREMDEEHAQDASDDLAALKPHPPPIPIPHHPVANVRHISS